MWGGIKGVVSALVKGDLFKGEAAPVQQPAENKPKAPRPPKPEVAPNPNNPGGQKVQVQKLQQDRSGEIYSKLMKHFCYPQTREELVRAVSSTYTDFTRKEAAWARTAPQDVIDRLLSKVGWLKGMDESSNRSERLEQEAKDKAKTERELVALAALVITAAPLIHRDD